MDSWAFFISIDRCSESDYCASNSEIDDFIETRSIHYAFNSQVYNPNNYTEGVVTDRPYASTEAMSKANPQLEYFKIQENVIDSEHLLLDLSFVNEKKTFFETKKWKTGKPFQENIVH